MVDFVETLFGIAAVCLLVAAVAWVQSRGGGDRGARYRRRMRRFGKLGLAAGALALALELWLQLRLR